ncbi:hypothetical protein K431DRAFT_299950 [Polychaeton citri CBS 116435]|uniref:Uncharacterized protein n=1 Tax=Polychaeton citri CBS 116435 TaxID=1314669 RepID=A0A9P4QE66_9PEZI|nr:hypothetical protein K431DRAFT_299950 [Polychaeton citri CBS 116435]
MAPTNKLAAAHNMTAAILSTTPLPTLIKNMSSIPINGTTEITVNDGKGPLIVGIVAAVLAAPPAAWVMYRVVKLMFKRGAGDNNAADAGANAGAGTGAAGAGAANGAGRDMEMGPIAAQHRPPQGLATPGEENVGNADIADERVEDAVEDDRNTLLVEARGVGREGTV